MSLDVREVAEALLSGEEREPLTDAWPDLDVDTAYEIQDEALRLRQARGETVIGVKLGLTSQAMRQSMGVDSPLLAWLTDAMVLPAGVPVPSLIHPRAEPELAFVLGKRLSGPGVTAATAMAAVDRVHGGIEIIDSRYRDYRFALPDAVADNGFSAYFTLGPVGAVPSELDLSLEAALVEVDGAIVDTATGAAVLGHPAEALALAANALGARGLALEPGWIVLTGGMTDAVELRPGSRVAAHFSHLGSITLAGS
ncbi:4-oxalocrotonate decarboxylase [Amycolatopsis coloradensis]|uniref:4-oxalocrotonate decarboxylase n=1 Tax=Amycolatopsis coloradensis TaxID=76021 RepID=A0A1R0KVV3_9PSEU|nr:fumarylacetoacetate hydrolase family protein [Amycolatopsis coloradensis]OLZ53137.1 4-oxalocrotonate decarboxylase [Amycolatopsis coloradensis]